MSKKPALRKEVVDNLEKPVERAKKDIHTLNEVESSIEVNTIDIAERPSPRTIDASLRGILESEIGPSLKETTNLNDFQYKQKIEELKLR